MKFFKNRNILFKLIVALCISLSVFGFVGSNTYQVMALTEAEQKAHIDKHEKDQDYKGDPKTDTSGRNNIYLQRWL